MATVMAEIGNSDAMVWDCLQKDVLNLMEMEKNTFSKVEREEAYN